MLRSILIGLDDTPDSEPALELGIRWAGRFEGLIVGMTVIDEPGVHTLDEKLLGEAAHRGGTVP